MGPDPHEIAIKDCRSDAQGTHIAQLGYGKGGNQGSQVAHHIGGSEYARLTLRGYPQRLTRVGRESHNYALPSGSSQVTLLPLLARSAPRSNSCSWCDRALEEDCDRLSRPAGSRAVLLSGARHSKTSMAGWSPPQARPPAAPVPASRRIPPQWPDSAYPQQLHFDIRVNDADQAEREMLALLATRIPGERETAFRVFADPAGGPFCIVFGRHITV